MKKLILLFAYIYASACSASPADTAVISYQYDHGYIYRTVKTANAEMTQQYLTLPDSVVQKSFPMFGGNSIVNDLGNNKKAISRDPISCMVRPWSSMLWVKRATQYLAVKDSLVYIEKTEWSPPSFNLRALFGFILFGLIIGRVVIRLKAPRYVSWVLLIALFLIGTLVANSTYQREFEGMGNMAIVFFAPAVLYLVGVFISIFIWE